MRSDDRSHKILSALLGGLALVAIWAAVIPNAVKFFLG